MKTIEQRIEDFRKTLEPFEDTYPMDMLYGSPDQLGFFEHWTQLSRNGKSFKQEKETTWTLSARLKTWARNNKNWFREEKKSNFKKNIDLYDRI